MLKGLFMKREPQEQILPIKMEEQFGRIHK